MATDQQFCLRWNNHQSTLISVFDSLLEHGTLVDCTLAAEGKYLKAHKVVLSACSPYLEALLSLHYEKHPIVILKDVKFSELKSMMDYMYRGEVNISQDQLGTFLKAAESLQIKGLSDNGDDARDVGSTSKKPDAPRPSVTQTRAPVESKRPAPGDLSDTSRDGSISPSSIRKRRRTRRPSQGDDPDSNLDNNVCDLPAAQSTPMPVPSAAPVQSLPKQIVKTEPPPPMPDPVKKEILDPPAEPLLEPKTEYLDYMNNENSIEVEDLTLDDDDEEGMDSSMDASRPGPSHGDLSNQGGYPPWTMTGDQSGTDEIFMAAQEAVGAAGQQQRDSQGLQVLPAPINAQKSKRLLAEISRKKEKMNQGGLMKHLETNQAKSFTGNKVEGRNQDLARAGKVGLFKEPTRTLIKIRSDLFQQCNQSSSLLSKQGNINKEMGPKPSTVSGPLKKLNTNRINKRFKRESFLQGKSRAIISQNTSDNSPPLSISSVSLKNILLKETRAAIGCASFCERNKENNRNNFKQEPPKIFQYFNIDQSGKTPIDIDLSLTNGKTETESNECISEESSKLYEALKTKGLKKYPSPADRASGIVKVNPSSLIVNVNPKKGKQSQIKKGESDLSPEKVNFFKRSELSINKDILKHNDNLNSLCTKCCKSFRSGRELSEHLFNSHSIHSIYF